MTWPPVPARPAWLALVTAVIAAAAPAAQSARVTSLDALELLDTTAVAPAAPHVQGIDVNETSLWVSAVDTTTRKGVLSRHDLRTGRRIVAAELQDGARYHPGGIQLDGEFIWVPVAEYRRSSSTWVQKRDRVTLALVTQFAVPDHIGCVAVGAGALWGGNWDSTHLYRWRLDGTIIDVRENPTGTRYQDLKFVDGLLIGSGLRGNDEGAVDWLEPETLELRRRVVAGRTDRHVPYTNEGMALRHGKLYLLPEDAPSRLFQYRLP